MANGDGRIGTGLHRHVPKTIPNTAFISCPTKHSFSACTCGCTEARAIFTCFLSISSFSSIFIIHLGTARGYPGVTGEGGKGPGAQQYPILLFLPALPGKKVTQGKSERNLEWHEGGTGSTWSGTLQAPALASGNGGEPSWVVAADVPMWGSLNKPQKCC